MQGESQVIGTQGIPVIMVTNNDIFFHQPTSFSSHQLWRDFLYAGEPLLEWHVLQLNWSPGEVLYRWPSTQVPMTSHNQSTNHWRRILLHLPFLTSLIKFGVEHAHSECLPLHNKIQARPVLRWRTYQSSRNQAKDLIATRRTVANEPFALPHRVAAGSHAAEGHGKHSRTLAIKQRCRQVSLGDWNTHTHNTKDYMQKFVSIKYS